MSKNIRLSKTVLLVDDLDILRKMIRDFLESLDIEVLEASNAVEAIHRARFHLSGWESASEIAGLRPGIRIFYMSAGISLQEWNDYKEKPVGTYFIQKPFRLEELKALLMAIFSK